MRIVFPLIIFIAINVYPILILKKSFGKVFPLTLILSFFIIYICGIFFHNFRIGYRILQLLSFIAIVIIINKLLRKDKAFIKTFFSRGFVFVILYYVFVLILNWNRGFNYVDEYCFWGFLTKEAFRLNDFYFAEGTRAWFNVDYPPFYTLFELLWCYFQGAYKEAFCYQALSFFSLSLFSCIFDDCSNNTIKTIVLFVISLLLGLTINYTEGMVYNTLFYNSIYVDLHIGVFIGYIFYILFVNDFHSIQDNVVLSISLSALILTKQVSIIFVLLFLITSFILILVNSKITIKLIFKWIGIYVSPILCLVSWKSLLNIYSVTSKFTSEGFNYLIIIDYIFGKANEYSTNIITNFINVFFTRSIIIRPFNLSYFAIIVINGVIMILPILFKTVLNKKSIVLNSILYFLGGVGYAYAMLITYIYGFSSSEGPGLIMFDRYMMTYVIAGFVYIFFIYSALLNDIKLLLCYLIVEVIMISPDTIVSSKPIFHYNGQENFYTERFNSLLYEYSISDNMLVIHQGDILKSCTLRYSIDKDIQYNEIEFNAFDCDIDTKCLLFNDQIKNYDYVYIAFFDERIIEIWNNFDNDEAKQDHLYKVIKDEPLCKLEALYNDW